MNNLLTSLPLDLTDHEVFTDIVKSKHVRIERIVSHGHHSPESGWYDQEENEWVMILEGVGIIEFDNGQQVTLHRGDHITILAHQKHRVLKTDCEITTIWLAVFYASEVIKK